jgi:hypothetical protein
LPAAAVTARPEDDARLRAAVVSSLRRGAALRVVASPAALIALAEPDALPWAPGAVYLGFDGGLLVPTTRAPSLPTDLLAGPLRAGFPADHTLVALLPWAVIAAPHPVRDGDPDALEAG